MKGTILLFSIQDDSEKINEERKQEIAKQATVNPELLRCENFPQCLHFSEINLNIWKVIWGPTFSPPSKEAKAQSKAWDFSLPDDPI